MPSPAAASRRWRGRRASIRDRATSPRTRWPRPSARSGCSPAAASARWAWGRDDVFLRGALDKLGIEPQFEQRHEYKNAADRIQRTELTPAHRESLEQLTGSIHADALQLIAASRSIDPDRLRTLMDASPTPLRGARRWAGRPARLPGRGVRVDPVAVPGHAGAAVRRPVEAGPSALLAEGPARSWRWSRRAAIVSGRSRRGLGGRQVGSDTVSAQLRAARKDDSARAVVLRVDSPAARRSRRR